MPESALWEAGDKTFEYDLPIGAQNSGSWFELIEVDQLERAKVIANSGVDINPTANWQDAEKLSVKDWGNEEPSTQADILNNIEDRVQELILQVRISKHERFANRLLVLYNEAKEEDPTSVGISLGSLSNFLNFLQIFSNLKKPSITLTPDNTVYTSWRTESCLFSMHFLPDGGIDFVIFSQNYRHPERKNRVSGTATGDTLKKILAKEAFDWILE